MNPDIVYRAYEAAGFHRPDKEDQQVTFCSTMARGGADGVKVLIELPHGKTVTKLMDKVEELASGLDVELSQVTITKAKGSARLHWLRVADRDPLSIPAGPPPFMDLKQRDIWEDFPLGVDHSGRIVAFDLMWKSILVGALKRMGKTFTAHLLLLYAALDPLQDRDLRWEGIPGLADVQDDRRPLRP